MERELGSKNGAQQLSGLVTSEIHRGRRYTLHGGGGGGGGAFYILFLTEKVPGLYIFY